MKVVKDTVLVELTVKKEELLSGKYIYYENVSAKLKVLEESNNTQYKALRNKFYNSAYGNKYNIENVCGLRCLNVEDPMKAKASLELSFKVV